MILHVAVNLLGKVKCRLNSNYVNESLKLVCQVCQEDRLVISHKSGQQDARDPTVRQTQ